MSKECAELHRLFNNMKRFKFPFDSTEIPLNGIYLLFEIGEEAHGSDRIVRVGTHTGEGQLRSRLQQHFIKENKDRSIFRKNIGRALLNGDSFLSDWELDRTARKGRPAVDLEKQKAVENNVTNYIQKMFSFVVFEVVDKSERLRLERKIISTVSWCDECKPSARWLGMSSPKEKIRESGLWLVNELHKEPFSMEEIKELKKLITAS